MLGYKTRLKCKMIKIIKNVFSDHYGLKSESITTKYLEKIFVKVLRFSYLQNIFMKKITFPNNMYDVLL